MDKTQEFFEAMRRYSLREKTGEKIRRFLLGQGESLDSGDFDSLETLVGMVPEKFASYAELAKAIEAS